MDALISLINKLHDVFNTVGAEVQLQLPQIVVVGSQSVGKSSVLENIVGRDFLPRGSGIVTRRPLVLQLINRPLDSVTPEETRTNRTEWGEFLHKTEEKFYDFEAIRQEIVAETDRVTGSNKGISPHPIRLRIFSPNVLNLTLVDLPGITKVPVGDQPSDIEKQIRDMILTFVRRPSVIILSVTAANTDLANSDSLKLSREVDPEGSRTIGVLTKVDLMDAGTNALDVLNNKVYPLRLGYVGIVCRSQLDIDNKKPIRTALQDEIKYFTSHPKYSEVAHRMGSTYLAKALNKILIHHIRESLPDLRLRVSNMLMAKQAELKKYGDSMTDEASSKAATLVYLLTKFCSDFRDSLDGALPEIYTKKELYGGARITYIFQDIFVQTLAKMDPVANLVEADIATAIKNSLGAKSSLFLPEGAFTVLVKRQIQTLEAPSLQCAEMVFDELSQLIHTNPCKEMHRFASLRRRVMDICINLLRRCLKKSQTMISNLVHIELSYINTNHPDFYPERFAPPPPPQPPPGQQTNTATATGGTSSGAPSNSAKTSTQPAAAAATHTAPPPLPAKPQETRDSSIDMLSKWNGVRDGGTIDFIKKLVASYFQVTRKNVMDLVPKAVMHFLVNQTRENLQNELMTALYKEELFNELLVEDEAVTQRRKSCQAMIELLKKATAVLNEVQTAQIN